MVRPCRLRPLQDDVISAGGGDVLSRWDGAFDGLHTMLGYGAITFDNTDEGRKLPATPATE